MEAASWIQENRKIGIPDVPQTCLVSGNIREILSVGSQQFIESERGKQAVKKGKTPRHASFGVSRGSEHTQHNTGFFGESSVRD